MLLAVTALCASDVAGSASQRDPGCNAITLPGKVYERSGADTYKSRKIEGGERLTVFSFPRRSDPLRGKKIIDENPTMAIALLSDGSKLSFNRDCRGVRCVYLNLRLAQKEADCWTWLTTENAARDRTPTGRFMLGGDRFVSFRNSRTGGHLLLHTESGNFETWVEEPLIVGPRPIVGFGVSVPAIHGPYRSLDVIRREKDGSLSLATYGFMYR